MQQIERYGVIALVFFLITIVAVSFWGDSKSPGFWSRLTGRSKTEPTADHITPPPGATDTALTPPAPLDTDPSRALVTNPGTAGGLQPVAQLDANGGSPVAIPADNKIVPGGSGATPAVNPPAPQPAPTASNEYTVQKGDSLALIARRTLGKESRWTEIAALNPGLTPKNLKVGAKLALPNDATAMPVASPETKAPPAKKTEVANAPKTKPDAPAADKKVAGGHTCKVQKGDTLKAIARRELGSSERWKEIAELNPGVSPSKLSIGQVLRLPGAAHAPETHDAPVAVADLPQQATRKPGIR